MKGEKSRYQGRENKKWSGILLDGVKCQVFGELYNVVQNYIEPFLFTFIRTRFKVNIDINKLKN